MGDTLSRIGSAPAVERYRLKATSGGSVPSTRGLVTKIGARFGIPVTEKVMAQSVPVIGAAGGAAINVLFIDHFHEVARGHFVVLRLEEKYGAAAVRDAYRMIGE